jgi:hypothetical protein
MLDLLFQYLGWALVAALAVLLARTWSANTRRSEETMRVATATGLRHRDQDHSVTTMPFFQLPIFHDGESVFGAPRGPLIRNVMEGEHELIFDLALVDPEDDMGLAKLTPTGTTVAAIRLPGRTVPSFGLYPEAGCSARVDAMRRAHRLDFLEDPTFSDTFRLIAIDEERVRSLFTPELRSAVLNFAEFCVEGGARDWLVVYTSGRDTIAVENIPSFLEQTRRIKEAFASAIPTAEDLPSLGPRSRRKFRWRRKRR